MFQLLNALTLASLPVHDPGALVEIRLANRDGQARQSAEARGDHRAALAASPRAAAGVLDAGGVGRRATSTSRRPAKCGACAGSTSAAISSRRSASTPLLGRVFTHADDTRRLRRAWRRDQPRFLAAPVQWRRRRHRPHPHHQRARRRRHRCHAERILRTGSGPLLRRRGADLFGGHVPAHDRRPEERQLLVAYPRRPRRSRAGRSSAPMRTCARCRRGFSRMRCRRDIRR